MSDFDPRDDLSDDLLSLFTRSAFRLETQPTYAMTYEADDFAKFLAGSPVPPPDVGWWRPWLDQMAALTRAGKRIGRVRIVDDPPSDYTRWELWAAPWHAQAGEQISYLLRARAAEVGLPLDADWWLLDDERVLILRYTDAGEMTGRELVTDPAVVAQHRKWRDLAVRHATSAGAIAAA